MYFGGNSIDHTICDNMEPIYVQIICIRSKIAFIIVFKKRLKLNLLKPAEILQGELREIC